MIQFPLHASVLILYRTFQVGVADGAEPWRVLEVLELSLKIL
jgi:hypothetical protein